MIARPLLVLVLLGACGSEAAKPAPAPAEPPAKASEPPAKAAPFAEPKLKPPPPPEGAALLPDRKLPLYVQRCDTGHPCPDLLQPAGETHCRDLELGGFKHWRLPDRLEVKRFGEIADLAQAEGFHWTRTAFAEDTAQAWIVDPKSGQETTIPRDRKPFRVRCVFEP
ncbi:hypothetical protein [Nannocystis bainbridge]|uniref:Lipoprotein n=1 Tax=Nannocystis bainbridge TaxID=2995303 RepID=A0ABT5DQK7_9BACT|nr:hypothetical protein [Nannocystis bainbridge]MDC0715836.1 hypothetical protein [Nannocystis bainbridge]